MLHLEEDTTPYNMIGVIAVFITFLLGVGGLILFISKLLIPLELSWLIVLLPWILYIMLIIAAIIWEFATPIHKYEERGYFSQEEMDL